MDGKLYGNHSQWSCENPMTLRRDLKDRIGESKQNFWVMSDCECATTVLVLVVVRQG